MEVGRAEIRVDVNDGQAVADLARVDAAFERTMARIDGEKAVYEIKGDLKPLEEDLKRAEAKVKDYDKRIAAADNARSKAALARYKEMAREEESLARTKLANARKELESQQARNKELDQTSKRLALIERHEQQVARIQAASERRRAAAAKAEERVAAARDKAQLRELSNAEKQAYAMERERQAVPKLEQAYVRLQDRLERLNTAARKARGDAVATERVNIDTRAVLADIEAIRARVRAAVGRDPIGLPVQVELGRDWGERLRMAMLRSGGGHGAWSRVGADIGAQMGRGVVDRFENIARRGIRNSARDFTRDAASAVGGSIARMGGRLAGALGGLGEASVRLGPFTTSVKGLIATLSILGPTILDIVGAAGALVGVLGAGLSGAATIGAGAITGLGLGFLGLKFSLRNVAQEYKNAQTVTAAYQRAVEKYGKGSKQAKTAQDQMNKTLATVSPVAREAAKGVESFYKDWDNNTRLTRNNLGDIARSGFQALHSITPMWANQTNQLSTTLKNSLDSAFSYISKGPGRNALRSIMSDFNASLPTLLHGLGSLGAAFLNFGREGAHAFPMLTHGFDDLAMKLLRFTERDDFGATVRRWVNEGRDVARFFGAAARVMMHFFGDGQRAGDRFINTMTQGLNRWDAFLTSASGRNSMSDFFERAVSGAEALWSALAPIGKTFIEWATNLSPFVQGILRGVNAVGNFVNEIMNLAGLNSVMGALGLTLGALWSVNKISSAATAVSGFARGLLGMTGAENAAAAAAERLAAAETAVAAASERAAFAQRGAAVGGAVGAGERALGSGLILPGGVSTVAREGEVAAQAATKVGFLARAGGLAKGALGALGAVVGITNPWIVGLGLAAGGAAVLVHHLIHAHDDEKRAVLEAAQANQQATAALDQNRGTLADTDSQYQRSAISVKQLREQMSHMKKGTDDYRLAELDLNDAIRQRNQLHTIMQRQNQTAYDQANKLIDTTRDQIKAFDDLHKSRIQQLKYNIRSNKGTIYEGSVADKADQKELNGLLAQRAQLQDAVTAAMNRQASVEANNARAMAGFATVTGQAEQRLGSLARLSRSAALKVAVKFQDPGDVSKVASRATSALKSGVPGRIVTKIVADSKDADQAIRRLNAARITPKKVSILEEGGKHAISVLEAIIGRKLAPKEQKIAQSGGQNVISLLQAIIGRKLPVKTQPILQRGASQVVSALAGIIGIRIPPKTTSVSAQTGGAVSAIGSVIGLLASIPRSVTTVITTQHVQSGGGRAIGRASGRGAVGAEAALVGEGSGPEIIANPRTGMASVVRNPTFMKLERDDYVIPTESQYRSRGRKLYEAFARQMGISGFKRGRLGKPGSPLSAAESLKNVKRYRDLQDQEDAQNDKITIAQRKVREPDSFLKKIGTDEAGNDLFAVDEAKKDAYARQVAAVRDLQVTLTEGPKSIMGQLAAAYQPAINSLLRFRRNQQDNIHALHQEIHHLRGTANNKDKHGNLTKAAKRAQDRIARDNDRIQTAKGRITDANSSMDDIMSDNRDAGRSRRPGYAQDLVDTRNTLSTLDANIASALASAQPAPVQRPSQGDIDVAAGTAAAALAQMTGDTAGYTAGLQQQLKGQREILAGAQALLKDNNKLNDVDAYNTIASAADAIKSINDTLGTLPGSPTYTATQAAAFSAALGDALSSFGANYALTPAAAPRFAGGGAYGPNAAAGAGGKVVQVGPGAVQQNFYQLPPAHTISKSIEWELGAL